MQKKLYWRSSNAFHGKTFSGHTDTKFLIVGGGIGGLTLAHFLTKHNVKPADIVIVEATTVGSGSTGHSAGMLVPESETEHDISWDGLIRRFGLPLIKTYRKAHLRALSTVEQMIREGKISCEAHMEDFLILAGKDSEKLVTSSLRARRKLGEFPGELRGPCLQKELASPRFSRAGKVGKGISVNPLKLAEGLASHLEKKGVHIYEHSPFKTSVGSIAKIRNGSIGFEKIIFANGMDASLPKLKKYVTSIAVTNKIPQKILRQMKLDDRDMFVDEHPVGSFHYGKITADKRLLVGYGDTLVSRNVSKGPLHAPHIRNIARFLTRAFPKAGLKIDFAWSAAYALTGNDFPVAKLKKNIGIMNGAGIQLGMIVAAHYLAAKLLEKKHPLEKLFSR